MSANENSDKELWERRRNPLESYVFQVKQQIVRDFEVRDECGLGVNTICQADNRIISGKNNIEKKA